MAASSADALKRHLVEVATAELENIWDQVAADPNKGFVLTDQPGERIQPGVCARTVVYGVWDILEPLLLDGSETLQEAMERAIALDALREEPKPVQAAERATWAWLQTRWLASMLRPFGVVSVRGELSPEQVEELRDKFAKSGGGKIEVIRPGDDHVPPVDIVCDLRPWWQRWLGRGRG